MLDYASRVATIDISKGIENQNNRVKFDCGSIMYRCDIVGNFIDKQNNYFKNPYLNDKVILLRSHMDTGNK